MQCGQVPRVPDHSVPTTTSFNVDLIRYSVIRHLSNVSAVGGHRKNDFPQEAIYMGKFS